MRRRCMVPISDLRSPAEYLADEPHAYCRKCKNYFPFSRLRLLNQTDLFCAKCLAAKAEKSK